MDVGESVWRDLAVPRRLSEAEGRVAEGRVAEGRVAEALARALTGTCGDEDLVRQVEQAQVTAACRCGCPSVRLSFGAAVLRCGCPSVRLQAVRRRPDGQSPAAVPRRSGADLHDVTVS